MFWKKKPGVIASSIANSLRSHPDKWKAQKHYLFIGGQDEYDERQAIRIWISSGQSFLRVESPWQIAFTRTDQEHIWLAYEDFLRGDAFQKQFLELLNALETM